MQKPGSEVMFLVQGGENPLVHHSIRRTKKSFFQMRGKVVVVAYFPFTISVTLCAVEYNVLI